MANLFQVIGHWGLVDKQIFHDIIIALGCPPELDSKTVLLKTVHPYIIEHGEMNLLLTNLEASSLPSSLHSAGRFYVGFYRKKAIINLPNWECSKPQ